MPCSSVRLEYASRRSALVWVFIICVTFVAGARVHAQADARITSVSGARLREEPANTASVLRSLPIGTELTIAPSTDDVAAGWIQVRTPSGATGWLAESLTLPFDVSKRTVIVEAIVTPRLPANVNGDPRLGGSFDERADVVSLLERVVATTLEREEQARLAWLLLRATAHALDATTLPGAASREGAWLERRDSVIYSDPAGAWKLRHQYVASVHDRFRGTAAADDIAWFLVENGIAGECEGDVPCYASFINVTAGEYLRRHPSGRHLDAATDKVLALDSIMDHLEKFPKVLGMFSKDECGPLRASLNPLRLSVERSSASDKAPALRAIGRYERLCPGSPSPAP